jgi:hypothetical protein
MECDGRTTRRVGSSYVGTKCVSFLLDFLHGFHGVIFVYYFLFLLAAVREAVPPQVWKHKVLPEFIW